MVRWWDCEAGVNHPAATGPNDDEYGALSDGRGNVFGRRSCTYSTHLVADCEPTAGPVPTARWIGSSMDLVPLLQLPAEDPKELQQQQHEGAGTSAGAAGGGGGSNGGSAVAPTLLGVLKRLQQQCTIFKRSAVELTDGDEEDVQVGGALIITSCRG